MLITCYNARETKQNRNVKFETRILSYIVDSRSKDKDIARPSEPDVSTWPIPSLLNGQKCLA